MSLCRAMTSPRCRAPCAVLFLPVGLFSVAAGALFGIPLGAAIVWVSAVLGECLAFLLGRQACLACCHCAAQQIQSAACMHVVTHCSGAT
jgi:hypothetical protein